MSQASGVDGSGVDGDADTLDSPLLDDNNQNNNNTSFGQPMGGGVTLHGESVDLRHMLFGYTSNSGKIVVEEEEQPTTEVTSQDDDSPMSNLSMDNQSSNTTRGIPSTLDYITQTIMYLPKKSRLLYYKTKHMVSSSRASRESTSEGLTPVDNNSSSLNNINDSSSSYNSTRTTTINKTRNQITQKSSLYSASSTPYLLKLLIPALLITNHILFYHAQTAPMWNLSYKTNVTISATASTLKSKAAADALNVPHHYEYINKETKVVETFTYWDAISKLWKGEGLGNAQTISKIAAVLLVVASGIWPHLKLLLVHVCWFVPFVHAMWLGNGSSWEDEEDEKCCSKGSCCKSTKPTSKTRCSLCCSNGHAHKTHTARSPFLRTLSTLGKWSLADVLVVCILIAVLHLDWQVHPDEIRSGIEKELPTLLNYAHEKYPDEVVDCTKLLGYTCGRHALVIHFPACLTCQGLISNAFHHPEWTTNEGKDILEGITLEGGGNAQLRVAGMVGTYYFCAAVIMSILLSLVVDVLDEKDRGCVEEDLLDRKRELEFILPGGENGSSGQGNELELREESSTSAAVAQPLLNEAISSDAADISSTLRSQKSVTLPRSDSNFAAPRLTSHSYIPSPTTNCYLLKHVLLALLSISSLPLVCYAVALPTMQRLVYGGGPTLLHEVLGMVWEKEYSLISLVKTTGDAGGWDIFLMLTFGLFAVVGPILRSCCLIMHVFLGLPVMLLGDCIERPRKRTSLRLILYHATFTLRKALLPVNDALGAFGCWEVLIVALLMIQLEMPSITDTIYSDDKCQEADPEHGRTCIEMQFNAMDTFLVVGIAWVVLTVSSSLAMDLAVEADEKSSDRIGGKEEQTWQPGQPIPLRRSNMSRSRAWLGSRRAMKSKRSDVGNGEEDDDEYYSPLQQQDEPPASNGLEEIVFV